MYLHANAKLGLAGRLALVQAVEGGCSMRRGRGLQRLAGDGASLVASLAGGGRGGRGTLSCLFDRSSRRSRSRGSSRRSSRRRSAPAAARPAGGRGWSRARPASRTRPSGRCSGGPGSRGRHGAKQPANRYEWPCPGDLLHMDVSRYARFLRPGHAVTGDRSQRSRAGCARDTGRLRLRARDRRRPLPARLRRAPRRRESATVTGFVERALAFFAEHGIIAKRLMTDNAFSYVKNRWLRELLARHGSDT